MTSPTCLADANGNLILELSYLAYTQIILILFPLLNTVFLTWMEIFQSHT